MGLQTIDINDGSSLRGRGGFQLQLQLQPPSSRAPPLLLPRLRSLPIRLPFRPYLPFLGSLPCHPCRAFLPFLPCLPCLPFRAFHPFLPFQAFLRILSGQKCTLHLRGVEPSKSFLGLFGFFVLIDPLGPVDLEVLVFLLGLEEAWPEGCGRVQFFEDEDEVEAGLGPLGGGLIDGFVELKGEGVFLAIAVSGEGEGGLGEFDVVVLDVPELHLQVDALLSLCPLRDRVTEQFKNYSMC